MNGQNWLKDIVGKIILVLIVLIVYSSCRYDSIVPIAPLPPKIPWLLDSSLRGENKFLLTSLTVNNSLLLVANSFLISNIAPSNINKSIDGNYIDLLQATNYLYPPSLSETISVSVIDNDQLAIYPTKCASCVDNLIIFKPPYSGSTTSNKGLRGQIYNSGGNKGGYPVIDSKYILAPFECEFGSETASFALIKIDTALNQFGSSRYGPNLHLNSYKIINMKGVPVAGYFAATYNHKFFVNIYGHTWRIDTLGNAKELPMFPYQMFTLTNRLFALSINSQLFVSDDQGENWSLFAAIDPSFASLQYFNVDGNLYATYEAQIWKATLFGNQISFTELDHEGLETNLITSMAKCEKYAFVTTTSGLYYRDTASFNLQKPTK